MILRVATLLSLIFTALCGMSQRLVPLVQDEDVYPFNSFESSFGLHSYTTYQNELLIAGRFTNWNSDEINYITKWDGHSYRKLGNNNLSLPTGYFPRDLQVLHDSLYMLVTKSPSNAFVIKYHETSGEWTTVGDTLAQRGLQIMMFQNQLILASQSGGLYTLDENDHWILYTDYPTSVLMKAMVYEDELYMMGTTLSQDYLFKYSGSEWNPISMPSGSETLNFALIDNTLCITGRFLFTTTPEGLAQISGNGVVAPPYFVRPSAMCVVQIGSKLLSLIANSTISDSDVYLDDKLVSNDYDFGSHGITGFAFQNKFHVGCRRGSGDVNDLVSYSLNLALPHVLVEENREDLSTDQFYFNTSGSPLIGFDFPGYSYNFRLNEDLGEQQIMSLMSLWQMAEVAGDTALNFRTLSSIEHRGSWMFGPASNVFDNTFLTKYARVWRLSASEVSYHQQHYADDGYQMPEAIYNWPAHGNFDHGEAFQIAPFEDLNGNTFYEPHLGEYPTIPGDEALFMMMNDALESNPLDGTVSAKAEVHLYYYTLNSTDPVLSNTLFVHGKLINRSETTWENNKLGIYNEWHIGFDNSNDYQGIDSLLNYVLSYSDTTGFDADFSDKTPTMACAILSEPVLHHVGFGNSQNPETGPAFNRTERENYINGLGRLGNPLEGTNVHNPGWLNSGDPCAGEEDTELYRQTTDELNNTLSTLGLHQIAAGGYHCFDLAYVLSYDQALSGLENLCALEEKVMAVKTFYDEQNNTCELATSQEHVDDISSILLWPNPTSGLVHVQIPSRLNEGTIRIFDLSGKLVESQAFSHKNVVQFDASGFPTGLYTLVITGLNGEVWRTKWVKCD